MARLPRLRSAGVQAAIPRSVDFAGFRSEAALVKPYHKRLIKCLIFSTRLHRKKL